MGPIDVLEPRVRETSETEGTGNIILLGAMRGSLSFINTLSLTQKCDIVISYGDTFEECEATLLASNELVRGTVHRSRHANGTVDLNHVSFGPGVKTVVMTFGARRMRDFYNNGAARFDVAQSPSAGQRAQFYSNFDLFPTGTSMLFIGSTAPPGWTKSTTHNDKAIRIVSGTASSGGSVNFSTLFNRTATDQFTLLQSHMPSLSFAVNIPSGGGPHLHLPGNGNQFQIRGTTSGGLTIQVASGPVNDAQAEATALATLPALFGTAASGGSNTPFQLGIDMRVKYVDAIICIKD